MNKGVIAGVIGVLLLICVGFFLYNYTDVEASGEFEMPSVDVDVDGGQLPKFEVEQTQETEMPSVDVDGDAGNIPEVEVRGPDIEIGTKEVEVPVPDVDVKMEKKKVEVPAIGIEKPGEEEDVVDQ